MIIYEVNLSIDIEIYAEYRAWLDEHILEMLKFSGFLSATILNQTMDSDDSVDSKHITVQYQLESAKDLQYYFDEHATKMRGDGVNQFDGRFTASRRIFEVESRIEAV